MQQYVTEQYASPATEFWEVPVFEISNQHILVTGGSSGFGRHFARFLAGNGAKVTLAARRAEALASAVNEINNSGGKASPLQKTRCSVWQTSRPRSFSMAGSSEGTK